MKDIFIPKDGASDTSVTITEVYFENGEYVNIGDVVLSYETSKASYEIDCDQSGYVYFFVNQNDKVDIGTKVFSISATELNENEIERPISLTQQTISGKIISKNAQKLIDLHQVDISSCQEEMITVKLVQEIIDRKTSTYNKDYQFAEQDVIIFGAGGHAGMCYDIISSGSKLKTVGFIDDNSSLFKGNKELVYFGKLSNVGELKARGLKNIVIGVGFLNNMKKKEEIYTMLSKEFNLPTIIHQKAIIEPSASISNGCQIMAGAIIGSNTVVKENCIINSGAIISHDSVIESSSHVTPGAIIAGHVEIGSRTIIGMGVTLYVGLKVGSDVLIYNGISVFEDVENGKIVS